MGLLLIHDLGPSPWAALACLGISFVGLGIASRSPGRVSAVSILLVAALLRLFLVPLPPSLSNDVWRYLWDGKVVAAGRNPYRIAPDARELVELRNERWKRLDHREIPTIYPPLAITLFSICARLPASVWAWKLLVVAADLLGCWLLLRLAAREGLPASRTIWYAWNPMVVMETAGMAHVDAVGVAAVVAAVLLLESPGRRVGSSAVAAAVGTLVKVGPVTAWPLWARGSGRPVRYLLVAGGLTAIALLPVGLSVDGVPPGVEAYALSWEFNGPLYEPLWRGLEALQADEAIKRGLDQAKALGGEHDLWNRWYPFVYPRLLAKVLLLGLAVAVWVRSWTRTAVAPATGELFGGLLLCSATVYPWYLLWVLPWAALYRRRAWLWASLALPLSYLAGEGAASLWPGLYLVIWGPFLGIALWERGRARGGWRPPGRPGTTPDGGEGGTS